MVNDALLWQPYILYSIPHPHRVQKVLCFGVDTVIAQKRLDLWRYLVSAREAEASQSTQRSQISLVF